MQNLAHFSFAGLSNCDHRILKSCGTGRHIVLLAGKRILRQILPLHELWNHKGHHNNLHGCQYNTTEY
ncbi:MAG TPA: hypothetical protein VJR94_05085 [Candidatus Nitrosocosmicus sp.]|nr:hypothetical protein [Candidatus Nitrosocosmicus sp.]